MASTLVDLVKITSNSTGSGAITLGGAVAGYRGLEALTNGEVYSYSIQDGDAWEFGRGTFMSATGQFIRTPIDSSDGGSAINLRQNAQVAFVALSEDLDAVQLSNDAVAAAAQVAIDAAQVAADRAIVEAGSKAVVNGGAVYPNAYATTVPQGVTNLSNEGIATGSGGTPGTYAGGVTGGPTGFSWEYSIGLDGKIASYEITSPGISTATTAPTLSYGSGSITGAVVPTATVAARIAQASSYWVISADGLTLDLYSNVAGTPSPVLDPTGDQVKVLVAAGAEKVVDDAEGWADASALSAQTSISALAELGLGPAIGVNILDMAGRGSANQAINTDGSIITVAGSTLSAPIRVKASSTYVTNKAFAHTRQLNAASAYIPGTYTGAVAAGATITMNAAAAYFQADMATNTTYRSMLLAGTALPAFYLAPGFLDPASDLRVALDTAVATTRRLLGTTASIIDPSKTQDGFALGANGVPYPFTGWLVTPFVQAQSSDSFITNFSSGANGACWYAEDGITQIGANFTITSGTAFTPPTADAKFWRAQNNIGAGDKTNVKAWLGTAVPAGQPGFPALDPSIQKRNEITNARLVLDASQPNPRQLFDKSNSAILLGRAITNGGATYVAAGYGVSGFNEVTAGVPHIANFTTGSGQVVYYDENFAIITAGTNYVIQNGVAFVPPAGAYYMRFSLPNWTTNAPGLYIYRAAYSTAAVTFLAGQPANNDAVAISGNTITFVTSGATGAQVNIGASTTATAANLNAYINTNSVALGVTSVVASTPSIVTLTSRGVGPAANAITLAKTGTGAWSVSAATMSGAQPVSLGYKDFGGSLGVGRNWAGKRSYLQGDSQVANNFFQGTMAALTGLTIVSEGTPGRAMAGGAAAIAGVDLSSYEMVINDHMANDFAGNRAVGTIADDYTVASFYGDMDRWLRNVLGNPANRNKRIVFFGAPMNTATITNSLGLRIQAYDDAMRVFCKKWSIPFLSLLDTVGFNTYNFTAGSSDLTPDGLHYNGVAGVDVGRVKGNFINTAV